MAGDVWQHALSTDYFSIACLLLDTPLIAAMKDMFAVESPP
jgi:hypothetical protein